MQSNTPISLRSQLELLQNSQHDNLNYFLVLSGTSTLKPLQHFYTQGESGAKPLWLNTPYRDWQEVMPHLVPIDPESPFIDWLDEQRDSSPDWGWLIASPLEFDAVFEHFESLTKIILPSAKEVFFRYWDAPQVLPIFQTVNETSLSELLGPVASFICAKGRVNHPQTPQVTTKRYPWWQLSAEVQQQLFAQNCDVLVANLIQQLSEDNRALYESYPLAVLQQKVRRRIKADQANGAMTSYPSIEAYLQKELNDE